MTYKASVIAIAVVCGFLLGSAPARAQDNETAIAKVPFAFVVDGQTIPAGSYEVRALDQFTLQMFSLTSPKVNFVVPVLARLAEQSNDESARFVFAKNETSLVLSEIWLGGDDGYRVSLKPAAETPRVVARAHN